MADLPNTRNELEALRAKLFALFQQAKARDERAEMTRLEDLAGEIDDALDDLALADLAGLASRVEALKAKIETATTEARSWPFGAAQAPKDHERPFRAELQDNDAFDSGPKKPAPAPGPAPAGKVPSVSSDWSANYVELWRTMAIAPVWREKAGAVARKIIGNQGRYAAAVAGTKVPWWFIAVVHAMECSLRFDQHIHNGDPLSARTVRVPKGRPPAGSSPFSWEESAADSIVFESLDKVSDWSLPSTLFHWHRYNGINNEYKRRGIPTPYLWSGSQHYRKGKYVSDGVFDPEEVSGQAGAAVILKMLIDLGAVTLKNDSEILINPAAAAGDPALLSVDTSGALRHVAAELKYPGLLTNGSKDPSGEMGGVRRVQEWLSLQGCVTSIDGEFGDSTAEQLRKFQNKCGRQPTGELDEETWALLTVPMRRALAAINHGPSSSLEESVIRVAQQHVGQNPTEIGGDNCGPWVRIYMQGQDGSDQLWCAGFVCLVIAQASRDLGSRLPFKRQVGVDDLVKDAKSSNRFIDENGVSDPIKRRSRLRPGVLFVVRESANDWSHVGIVLNVKDQTFDTLEGNTSLAGSRNGTAAKQGNRSYPQKDFLTLV